MFVDTLGWKGVSGTNALAYYKELYVTAIKSFIGLGPGANVVAHFMTVMY
jgi:hypothetical protein